MWRPKTTAELAADARRARWRHLNPLPALGLALAALLAAGVWGVLPARGAAPLFVGAFLLAYALRRRLGGGSLGPFALALLLGPGQPGATLDSEAAPTRICPCCRQPRAGGPGGGCAQCGASLEAPALWTTAPPSPSAPPSPRHGRYAHRYPRPPRAAT